MEVTLALNFNDETERWVESAIRVPRGASPMMKEEL
jgi:hypothetical protein